MAIEEMFTELPTVANSTLGDIICAVQGYVSPSSLGTSTQQTLQQVYNLFKSSVVQFNAGNPNGSVAGTTYEFCWDTVNNMLWICTTTGTTTTAVWTKVIQLTAGSGISIVQSGDTITISATGTPVTSITGTANQVLANGTSGTPQTGAVTLTLPQSIATTSSPTFAALTLSTPLTIPNGGSGVTSVTTAPGGSVWAGWDANSNMSANAFIEGFATTVTAAGTTTLTVASKQVQEFTGSTTQTVVLPVAATMVQGMYFDIINNSSGILTINSSGGNLVLSMAANTTATVVCVLNSGTTAASWNASYIFDNGAGVLSITGTANQVIASASTGAVTLSLPQSIATSSTPTFANLILTGAAIQFTGGVNMLALGNVASAVNYLVVNNAATTFAPSLGVSGTDTNIGMTWATKGTGVLTWNSEATTDQVHFGSGTSLVHTSIFNFPATAASRTYTWPDATGTVLLTAGSGGLKSFQVFTSGTAATYTRPAGISSILVEAVGGGGGGGGAAISTGGGAAGGGGGGGGYCRLWVAAAPATATYTVGTGGAGGTAGNNNGATGVATTFVGTGANIAAQPGIGGSGSPISTSSAFRGAGGGGGTASGGDVNIVGGTGNYGYTTNAAGTGFTEAGYGGGTYLGDGGVFNPAVATGATAAANSGAGGGGGGATNNGSAFAGGAGAAGIIIVWEFA